MDILLILKVLGIILLSSIIITLLYYTISQIASSAIDLKTINTEISKLTQSDGSETISPTTTPTTIPITTEPSTYEPVDDGTYIPTGTPEKDGIEYCSTIGKTMIYDDVSDKCKFYPYGGSSDLGDIVYKLKNQNKILKTGNTQYDLEVITKPIANLPVTNIKTPKWMQHWLDKGGYNANNLISGENFWGEGVNCDCGDCAAWRGGNTGSCSGYNKSGRGKNMNRRVACDVTFDKRRCVCAYPFVPINGICVSPFKYEPNPSDNSMRPCCPPCVYNNTCIGIEQCKGECKQNLVELPGIKYNCTDINDNDGNIIDISNKNCSIDINTAHGMNEYECAVQCTGSQIDCSRRCLPKLWVWQTLTDSSGNIVGYRQTNKLVQYENNDYSLEYCPIDNLNCKSTLETNIEGGIDIQNCTDCTDCKWEENTILNEYTYTCSKCNKCITNKDTGNIDSNGYRILDRLVCEDNIICKGCSEVLDPINSRQNIIGCNYCLESNNGCIINNIGQPQNPGTTNLVTYNKGDSYNPKDNLIWQDFFKFGDSSTAIGCSTFNKGSTCETIAIGESALNDNSELVEIKFQGEADGGALGWSNVYNEYCGDKGDCNVPITYIKESEPTCYGSIYYDQMDIGCETIPLTQPNIDIYNIDYDNVIKYGVAKGLSKDICKEFYCKKWNWTNNKWTSIKDIECDAICEPDLYKNFNTIPEFSTTGEQISYLTNSGSIGYCFSGRFKSEFSGDCIDIPLEISIPNNISAGNGCSTENINCSNNICPPYAGGYSNMCTEDNRKELSKESYPQRQICNNNSKCECEEGKCYQNGICLSQSDNQYVKYGIARGLPEWQCPYYYCNVYDRKTNQWVKSNSEDAKKACAAICLPDIYNGYNSIPDTITTTKEQVDYLTKSGYRQKNPNPDKCKDIEQSTCNIL